MPFTIRVGLHFEIHSTFPHSAFSPFVISYPNMTSFTDELSHRLAQAREQNLFRELRRVDSAQGPRIHIAGREFLNFSANDYLGLATHPALKSAAAEAVEKYGAGAGASRLISGSLEPFHELETALARFKKTESALGFATGYAAATGTIPALMGKDDIIILDKLVHASIVDGARLSGAKLRIFAHNDPADLEEKLQWAAKQMAIAKDGPIHTLVITESVFSMDGDLAPLAETVTLKEKYGAWLMVDEAHATGVIGKSGRGLADELGVGDRIEIQMGTLGKALGASGGYICGARALIEYLINRARSFIFSTAPVPAAAAAAAAAIKLLDSPEGFARRRTLWELSAALNDRLRLSPAPLPSAIIPIILGDESRTLAAAEALRAKGIYIPAIRYPTVARGQARLRVTLTAAHSMDDIAALANELAPLLTQKS